MAKRLFLGAVLALGTSIAFADSHTAEKDEADAAVAEAKAVEAVASAVNDAVPGLANSFSILADISLNVASQRPTAPGTAKELETGTKSVASVAKRD